MEAILSKHRDILAAVAGAVGVALGRLLFPLIMELMASDPPPIAGVYCQPGRWYWLKRAVFAVMFRHRARQSRKDTEGSNTTQPSAAHSARGLGRSMAPHDMECCQPLPPHPRAMDAVYIGAYSGGDGPSLSLRVARRHERQAEIWMVLQVPGVGCLEHPIHPDTLICNTDPNSFSAGGLTFQVLHPMKTWRVHFSGPLRVGPCNSLDNRPDKFVDTSFSFQWDAFAPPFNYDSDLSASLLGDAIARETWTKDYFEKLQSLHQTHYEQWGELKGTLTIEGRPAQYLRLKAIRDHSFGVRRWTDFHRYIYCFLYIENGVTLQVGAVSQPGLLSHLRTGCLTYPTGEVVALTSVTLNLWEVGEEEGQPPEEWELSFTADGVHYDLRLRTKSDALLFHEADRGGVVHEAFCDVTLNGRQGWGLSEFFYRAPARGEVQTEPVLPLLAEPVWEEVQGKQEELYLLFTSPACCSSALVGGKGSQLALLTQVAQWEAATVPPGLCVTLKAFDTHMESCGELEEAVKKVADTAVSDPQKLNSVCGEASRRVGVTAVCQAVRGAVKEGLTQLFGPDWTTRRLAVRSSAAGEDGSDASSAGQMDTFLGVRGQRQVFEAVQKCWASAFTFQAVEYRRQRGQPVMTSVGVVIQEMVPAEAAGVLFTADPITNNTSLLSISANFGLGESVVSGLCEPDTVKVRRQWDDSVVITERRAGRKAVKVTMQEGGGTGEVQLSADQGQQCCLSDDVLLSLARLGIQIEKYFGSPRDIEWAYASGTIHLLQARPITTSAQETEEELIHEFDSPLAGGYEWLTTGNIGEMMPGAVTPLTLSTFVQAIGSSLQRLSQGLGARQRVVDFPKAVTSCGNHLFISLTDICLILLKVALSQKEVAEVNLLGETRPDLSMAVAKDYVARPLPGPLTRAANAVRMLWYLNKGSSMTKRWERRMEGYSVGEGEGEGCSTARALYSDIHRHLPDFMEVWHWTLVNSSKSGSWNLILLNIINSNLSECTAEHFGDIALLLSQCRDVFSAEVPSAIQDLAKQISQDGLKDQFCSATDQECVAVLGSEQYPMLRHKTRTFLQRHGHRCIREAEMREKSWQLDLSKLISVLKTILQTGSCEKAVKETKTAEQLISEIKTPLSYRTRKILQFLLPRAWAAVASREWGKSISVKMNDIFKTAYWKLAALMVKEGRLPDEDLMFFLTHYEIGRLLESRSARLVMKAQRRRKVLARQMDLRFPKISIGHPQPVVPTTRSESHDSTATTLKGMPVSEGVVSGPARVVCSLQDAHTIQAGDVLVVNSTDVGWSPYFPLIAGLVTEIGGLISHGAVVAREYGIPCVVNIPDATLLIHSGCKVELDGRAGTVRVLP
ncbi:rifampicin phosphotransferase-like isoform X1 [Babylonia areolata]|uniref:rifampicin phosphotransferase-like isoform X1 n=1 Tax=Babylonia areolata TaxID=304850 RepID=UPI003FD5DBE7